MSILSHLTACSARAVLSPTEKSSIQASIKALSARLKEHFGSQLADQFVFGSHARGTILPRAMDPNSDVDYMVVFRDGGLQPQSYLQRLKVFADAKYKRSEVVQSNPTIVLKLNHIHFELVPALPEIFGEYNIPAPAENFFGWLSTEPKAFGEKLVSANTQSDHKLKPVIRLIKYWNACASRPFASYTLESQILGSSYLFCNSLADYFYEAFDTLYLGWSAATWREDKLSKARQCLREAQDWERRGYKTTAEKEIRKLIP